LGGGVFERRVASIVCLVSYFLFLVF